MTTGATIHALAGLLTASYAEHLPTREADMMRAAAVAARDEHDAMRDRIVTLKRHREQWRRVAYRYRDALEAIEGGHVCDEGHREEARRALHNIEDSHPVDGTGLPNGATPRPRWSSLSYCPRWSSDSARSARGWIGGTGECRGHRYRAAADRLRAGGGPRVAGL